MIETVEIQHRYRLSDYGSINELAELVRGLRVEASMLVPTLRDRTVWMVNSTAVGGGVAEMLPHMVGILEELGVSTRWVVMNTDRPEFFRLTKQLHNLIHGEGTPDLTSADRELYEAVNRENAAELAAMVQPGDIVVIHDPQPMAMGPMIKERVDCQLLWRCHIGLDEDLPATRAAWDFLEPYAREYQAAVFSAPEYIPEFFAGRATIIHPGLDPCSHKNRELWTHKLVGILSNSGLLTEAQPVLTPRWGHLAQRLRPDGTFAPAMGADEIGLLYRPIITQVSRWDRLKGFKPLLDGFVRLKETAADAEPGHDGRHQRRIDLMRLVLAGPDPASIQDDPEGQGVLEELCAAYRELPPAIQADVALLTLPMESRKQNALMVNALQQCSTLIVQNSLREGFGLTATEAMWKGINIVGTRACGLRQQIRSGIDGVLVQDAEDPDEIAHRVNFLLADVDKRLQMRRNAKMRVHREFLIFTQLCNWLRLLSDCAAAPPRG